MVERAVLASRREGPWLAGFLRAGYEREREREREGYAASLTARRLVRRKRGLGAVDAGFEGIGGGVVVEIVISLLASILLVDLSSFRFDL